MVPPDKMKLSGAKVVDGLGPLYRRGVEFSHPGFYLKNKIKKSKNLNEPTTTFFSLSEKILAQVNVEWYGKIRGPSTPSSVLAFTISDRVLYTASL